jgi:hypothetical protein
MLLIIGQKGYTTVEFSQQHCVTCGVGGVVRIPTERLGCHIWPTQDVAYCSCSSMNKQDALMMIAQ